MIIRLDKSKLFTVAPEKRFAKEFNVSETVWRDCWVKYKALQLTVPELRSYIEIRTGRKPSSMSVKRWIDRSEIYVLSNVAKKNGASVVVASYFREYEDVVVNELVRHLKSGVTREVRSLV